MPSISLRFKAGNGSGREWAPSLSNVLIKEMVEPGERGRASAQGREGGLSPIITSPPTALPEGLGRCGLGTPQQQAEAASQEGGTVLWASAGSCREGAGVFGCPESGGQ